MFKAEKKTAAFRVIGQGRARPIEGRRLRQAMSAGISGTLAMAEGKTANTAESAADEAKTLPAGGAKRSAGPDRRPAA